MTSKQVAAQLNHPALHLPHCPMKAQSPNPSGQVLVLLLVLVQENISALSPFLPWESKNKNLYSLHFLVFVTSFTACVTDPP